MKFNPEVMIGNFIEVVPIGKFGVWNCPSYSGDWSDKTISIVKDRLIEEYEDYIPDENRLLVTFIIKPPVDDADPFSNTGTIGWKYTPKSFYEKSARNR